jgi:uncharacterized protein YkwD
LLLQDPMKVLASIIVACLIPNCTGNACAADNLATAEAVLLQLINEARKDPLGTAESLGKSSSDVLAALPDLASSLREGMAPLTLSPILSETAAAHNSDMAENKYYAMTSATGDTPMDRMVAAGYGAYKTGETLGELTFVNFMSSEQGVRLMFQQMFLDELNPNYAGQRNILDPEMKDVGIAVDKGSTTIAGQKYNFYLATCDFGVNISPERRMALELVQLINQARNRPLDVAAAYGLDRETILADHQGTASYYLTGLPPLAVNDVLVEIASSHTKDMVSKGYFSKTGFDGKGPEERLAAAGYQRNFSGEKLISYTVGSERNNDAVVENIFRNLLLSELAAGSNETNIIFNIDFEDVGIALKPITVWTQTGPHTQWIGTIDSGAPIEMTSPVITGIVYQDKDNNGFYNAGEGVAWEQMTIPENGTLRTDAVGGFQLSEEPGVYTMSLIRPDQTTMDKEVDLDFQNKAVYFEIDDGSGAGH